MAYLGDLCANTGLLDSAAAKRRGLELNDQYVNGKPFPHIAIDDFLPESVLERCLSEFPSQDEAEHSYDRKQERWKRSYSPELLPDFSRHLFYSFNSRPFIQIVENITGIEGLIPDPYFMGGGFHEIAQGGHLSVHADFNRHPQMNLERRVNMLIYLNRDWAPEYGGQLELWDNAMKERVQSYVPEFNRCVIFSTTSKSNHGNPNPIQNPNGVPRRSIALYYYTATWDDSKRDHTTQFRIRPGSGDARDITVRRREVVRDLVPPMVLRGARRLTNQAQQIRSRAT